MAHAADLVRSFLDAIASGAPPEAIGDFYTADARQMEYPNRLVPAGAERDRAGLIAAAAAGAKVLQSQSYEIVSLTEAGDFVALEARWRGILAVPVGSLKPGDTMVAHFAQFYELKGGKIHRQRNYDCFEVF